MLSPKTMAKRSTKLHERTQRKAQDFSGGFVDRLIRLLVLVLVVAGVFAACGGRKTAVKDFDAASDEQAALDEKVKKGIKSLHGGVFQLAKAILLRAARPMAGPG